MRPVGTEAARVPGWLPERSGETETADGGFIVGFGGDGIFAIAISDRGSGRVGSGAGVRRTDSVPGGFGSRDTEALDAGCLVAPGETASVALADFDGGFALAPSDLEGVTVAGTAIGFLLSVSEAGRALLASLDDAVLLSLSAAARVAS